MMREGNTGKHPKIYKRQGEMLSFKIAENLADTYTQLKFSLVVKICIFIASMHCVLYGFDRHEF